MFMVLWTARHLLGTASGKSISCCADERGSQALRAQKHFGEEIQHSTLALASPLFTLTPKTLLIMITKSCPLFQTNSYLGVNVDFNRLEEREKSEVLQHVSMFLQIDFSFCNAKFDEGDARPRSGTPYII